MRTPMPAEDIVVIELAPHEARIAVTESMSRWLRVVEQGYRGLKTPESSHCHERSIGADSHVKGTLSEMALAKHLGLYWSPGHEGMGGEPPSRDVGEFQVRSTMHRNGCLRLYDRDNPDHVTVLATIDVSAKRVRVSLVGWILNADGLLKDRKDLKRKGCEGYWIPQSMLNTIETLNPTGVSP